MKQASTAKRQAEAARVEVQTGRQEQQKLKALLENVLVSPLAFDTSLSEKLPTRLLLQQTYCKTCDFSTWQPDRVQNCLLCLPEDTNT